MDCYLGLGLYNAYIPPIDLSLTWLHPYYDHSSPPIVAKHTPDSYYPLLLPSGPLP